MFNHFVRHEEIGAPKDLDSIDSLVFSIWLPSNELEIRLSVPCAKLDIVNEIKHLGRHPDFKSFLRAVYFIDSNEIVVVDVRV